MARSSCSSFASPKIRRDLTTRRVVPLLWMAVAAALMSLVSGCENRAPLPPDDFVAAVPLVDENTPGRWRAHAHNDYEHPRPLLDALDARYYSVEVDLFWRDGQFAVAHYPWEYRGDLVPLYLNPLERLVRERGSVFGDGEPFTLWIDLKDDSDALVDALHERLAESPDVFTRYFDDMGEDRKPIRVILTGAAAKERYVLRAERFAIRDSNTLDATDPPLDRRFGYYALPHGDTVGGGSVAAAYAAAKDAAQQRGVRIFGAPDTEENWCAQWQANIDFIGTDQLTALGEFLDAAATTCGD